MPQRVYEIAQVCKRHGMRVGGISLSTNADGRELLEADLPCVAFYHMNARGYVGLNNARISLSGWEFSLPCRQIGDREYLVALSDHSDFDGLLEYVKRSRAKKVITDNYRSQGAVLAKEIRKRLGISAVPMPRTPGQTTL
jgi:putative mRNA 3-end processing factor